MNLKYLYGKIMGAPTNNDLVEIPFLTAVDLKILSDNNITYQKQDNAYLVNASQAKAVFNH